MQHENANKLLIGSADGHYDIGLKGLVNRMEVLAKVNNVDDSTVTLYFTMGTASTRRTGAATGPSRELQVTELAFQTEMRDWSDVGKLILPESMMDKNDREEAVHEPASRAGAQSLLRHPDQRVKLRRDRKQVTQSRALNFFNLRTGYTALVESVSGEATEKDQSNNGKPHF